MQKKVIFITTICDSCYIQTMINIIIFA